MKTNKQASKSFQLENCQPTKGLLDICKEILFSNEKSTSQKKANTFPEIFQF